MAELSDVKRLIVNNLSDKEIIQIFGSYLNLNKSKRIGGSTNESNSNESNEEHWFDKPLIGLDEDGLSRCKELEEEQKRSGGRRFNNRQLRYLQAFKEMKLEVPEVVRNGIDPRKLYAELSEFCVENDIPNEIISKLVPVLVTWAETGHIRPTILVGEKGSGKTTALRLLLEKALHLPVELVKAPHQDTAHGMVGDSGTFQDADCGCLAKARYRLNHFLLSFIIDEIDKIPHSFNRSNLDDELLSITDESNNSVQDNFLETTLVGLELCPMFFTANDLEQINPILVDRCTVIKFPSASATRIKSICGKYVNKKLDSRLYENIDFDHELMYKSIDLMVANNITSLRKGQQMVESVLDQALSRSLSEKGEDRIKTTEEMFNEALKGVLGIEKRKIGF